MKREAQPGARSGDSPREDEGWGSAGRARAGPSSDLPWRGGGGGWPGGRDDLHWCQIRGSSHVLTSENLVRNGVREATGKRSSTPGTHLQAHSLAVDFGKFMDPKFLPQK